MRMQRVIFFFFIFALSLATDVSVYYSYEAYHGNTKPAFESVFPWKFGFTSSDQLNMGIYHINKPPGVIAVRVSYESDLVTVDTKIVKLSNGKKDPVFVRQLNGSEAIINLNLHTSHGLCTSIRVAEGRVVSNKSEKEYKRSDVCFKGSTKPCMLLADLKNLICNGPSVVTQKNENLKTTTPFTDLENNKTTFVSNSSSSTHENEKSSTNSSANNTETNDQQPPPQNNVLIYVILSLIGMCVIILVIYISIKKYCLRNSHPEETIELNTFATANEVVYADLSFMHGDSQSPRPDEQSPYAEIIGVLHPHCNEKATANEVVYADLSLTHGDSQSPRPDEESPYAEIIGVFHPR